MKRQQQIEHAKQRLSGKSAAPVKLNRPAAPLTCIHLGEKIPGQPCGSQLFRCKKHDAVTTRFIKCDKASRHCATCADFATVDRPAFPPVTTRHLLYHIYPVAKNGVWQWNVEQLCRRISLFNGIRVVAVAVDPASGRFPDPTGPHAPDPHRQIAGCDTFEAVVAAFGGHAKDIEFVRVENNPSLREVATFPALFERAARHAGDGDAYFYAQAKGVTRPPGHVAKRWAEVMYELLLDYYPVIEKGLKHHPVAGVFKKHGKGWTPGQSSSSFHYSGSFWWARSKAYFSKPNWRKIDNFWSGIEPLITNHFKNEECYCAFHEGDIVTINLYNRAHWRARIEPELVKWKQEHAAERMTFDAPENH